MPWELVSGPDLGGGFLHQLTAATDGEWAEVVFHAQEGGMDASGPPAGSPVPFGYRRVVAPCPIGGRECYHREFRLPLGEVSGARLAYNRMRFVFAAMLEQEYRGAPVPMDAALEELGRRMGAAPGGPPTWWLAGRAAARRLGAPEDPRQIELRTEEAGVPIVADLLHDYLIEPVAVSEWTGLGRVQGGRAYVGTLRSGARVSFCSKAPAVFPGVPAGLGSPRELSDGGPRVRCLSLLELWLDAGRSGDRASETALRSMLRTGGLTAEEAEAVVRGSKLPAEVQGRLLSGW